LAIQNQPCKSHTVHEDAQNRLLEGVTVSLLTSSYPMSLSRSFQHSILETAKLPTFQPCRPCSITGESVNEISHSPYLSLSLYTPLHHITTAEISQSIPSVRHDVGLRVQLFHQHNYLHTTSPATQLHTPLSDINYCNKISKCVGIPLIDDIRSAFEAFSLNTFLLHKSITVCVWFFYEFRYRKYKLLLKIGDVA